MSFSRLEDLLKRFANRFVTCFQHANAYHIVAMSFVWIKTTNNCCNIITVESNIWKRISRVFLFNVTGSLLEFCIMEYCLAKKELNSYALFLKSVTYLPWWKSGGIQGIYLLFNNVFNIDQKVFALVAGSINFWDIRK